MFWKIIRFCFWIGVAVLFAFWVIPELNQYIDLKAIFGNFWTGLTTGVRGL